MTGGADANGVPVATVELYDPATGQFQAMAPMKVARTNHAALVLITGDVLVTGGSTSGGGYSDSAEIYRTARQRWDLLQASLGQAVSGHTMVNLVDGNVLIAGGTASSGPITSLLLFRLSDSTIRPVGNLLVARTGSAAAAVPDGRVLVVGGTDIDHQALASTELFTYSKDSMTGTVTSGPAMTYPRTGATATTTYDGVAVIGGSNGQADLGNAEVYSQWGNTFRLINGATPRSQHIAAALPNNGGILATGGTGGKAADLLQPWANSHAGAFIAVPNSPNNLNGGFASASIRGSLLAGGGSGVDASKSAAFWFPTIATDKADYPPGTTVQMTGAGFLPGEHVDLHLHIWVNQTVQDPPDYTVTADALGNFSFVGYAPNNSDIGALPPDGRRCNFRLAGADNLCGWS